MREYTALPFEYLEEMDVLSDAEYGRLIRALQEYSMSGQEPELNGTEKVYWKRVRNRENRYRECFEDQDRAKSERALKAANARWSNAKDANACASIVSNAKNAKTKANTETKTNTKAKNIPPKSPQGDAFGVLAGDDKALSDALTAFTAMRKQIKAPMTDRAKSMMAKRLTELSGGDHASMIAILDQSTVHCWKDVYELKGQAVKTNKLQGGQFAPQLDDAALVKQNANRMIKFLDELRRDENAECAD